MAFAMTSTFGVARALRTPNSIARRARVAAAPRRVAVSCAAKDELLSLIDDSLASRSEINACILETEKEAEPVDLLGSTIIDGEWDMKYIGSLAPGAWPVFEPADP